MFIPKRARRGAISVAALLLPASAIAGFGLAGAVSAQTPPTYYPLFNVVSGNQQGGDLTIATGASSTTVTIYLQNVIPNTTYSVSDCTVSAPTVYGMSSSVGCATATPATISSDANGNATATVTFQTTTVGTILISDPANAGDSYEATPAGMPLMMPITGTPSMMPNITLPSPLPPDVGPFVP